MEPDEFYFRADIEAGSILFQDGSWEPDPFYFRADLGAGSILFQDGSWSRIKKNWMLRTAMFLITNLEGKVRLDLQFLQEKYQLHGQTNARGP